MNKDQRFDKRMHFIKQCLNLKIADAEKANAYYCLNAKANNNRNNDELLREAKEFFSE